jgi:hypothetical protein
MLNPAVMLHALYTQSEGGRHSRPPVQLTSFTKTPTA